MLRKANDTGLLLPLAASKRPKLKCATVARASLETTR
jgi:hypothetical protein